MLMSTRNNIAPASFSFWEGKTYDRNKASPSPSQNEPAGVPAEAPSDMTWSGGPLNVVRQLGMDRMGWCGKFVMGISTS